MGVKKEAEAKAILGEKNKVEKTKKKKRKSM